jgi:transposase
LVEVRLLALVSNTSHCADVISYFVRMDDGYKRQKGSKVHMAGNTLGHLLAVHVTPVNEQERAQVDDLAQQVQAVTGETVSVAFADQGYTGQDPAQAARAQGIDLHVFKLPEAKKGFVLLPRRRVVGRSFGRLNRFRRLTRDYERLPDTLAALRPGMRLAPIPAGYACHPVHKSPPCRESWLDSCDY